LYAAFALTQTSFAKVYFEFKNFRGEHDFSLASWLGCIQQTFVWTRSEIKKENRKILFANFPAKKPNFYLLVFNKMIKQRKVFLSSVT